MDRSGITGRNLTRSNVSKNHHNVPVALGPAHFPEPEACFGSSRILRLISGKEVRIGLRLDGFPDLPSIVPEKEALIHHLFAFF